MHKKKFHFGWVLVFVLVLLASQLFSSGSGAGRLNDFSARASEMTGLSAYLPLVIREFPGTPTSFGIDLGAINAGNGSNQMVQAGSDWVRRDGVDWAAVEPNKGDRNWSAIAGLEADLVNAYKSGLTPIVVVSGTPAWAQKYSGYGCGPIKSEEFASFAGFMHDLVKRYSGPPFNVKYWEIWNEPDVSYFLIGQAGLPDSRYGCWGELDDPYYGGEYYGQMLSVVTPQIKLANPSANVLVGGLLLDCDPINPPEIGGATKDCTSSRFFEGVLKAGGGAYLDGISFHAYDYYDVALGKFSNPNWNSSWDTTGPVAIAKANYLSSLLSQYGVEGKFLINTEAAVICGGAFDDPGLPPCDSDPGSAFELSKAHYVVKTYAINNSLGLRASIWYQVFGWRNSGLLYGDLSGRPAYAAYAVTENAVGGAEFQQKIEQFAGVDVYEYSDEDKLVWILWSKDGLNHTVDLSTLPTATYDALGNPLTPALTVQSGMAPIFLEWAK